MQFVLGLASTRRKLFLTCTLKGRLTLPSSAWVDAVAGFDEGVVVALLDSASRSAASASSQRSCSVVLPHRFGGGGLRLVDRGGREDDPAFGAPRAAGVV